MITNQQLAHILVGQLHDDETWDEQIRLIAQVLEGPALPSCPHLLIILGDRVLAQDD